MGISRFLAVLSARNKEFWRDRSSLSWNLFFPFLLVFGFAVIFNNSQAMFKVGILGEQDAYLSKPQLFDIRHIQFIPYSDETEAVDKLRQHQLDLLLELDQRVYWVNRSSPKGYMVEKLLTADDEEYRRVEVDGRPIRYVDWVLPGIIGMNVMFSCLFGVGYVIVRYRKNGVLKRLKATPLSAVEFLSAQIISRWLIVMFVALIIFFGCHLVLDTLMLGSYGAFFLVLAVGVLTMISLGLVIASRTRSEELTGGLLNLASWPMMGLSGVWFSLEGAPQIIKDLASLLPLTHIVEATRAISVEGATLASQMDHMLILMAMGVVFLTVGALTFSWDPDGR
jgi:ABC-2 type transport system permease protein